MTDNEITVKQILTTTYLFKLSSNKNEQLIYITNQINLKSTIYSLFK